MSNAFNYRRNKLYLDFAGRVNFIVIDPNANESMDEVRAYARTAEFDYPVYKDIGNVVADRFGAQITTDTFVRVCAALSRRSWKGGQSLCRRAGRWDAASAGLSLNGSQRSRGCLSQDPRVRRA